MNILALKSNPNSKQTDGGHDPGWMDIYQLDGITNSTYIHTGGTLRSSGTGWIRSDSIHGMGRFAAFGVSVLVFGGTYLRT